MENPELDFIFCATLVIDLWLPRVGKFLKNLSPAQCFHRLEDSFEFRNNCFVYDFKVNTNVLFNYIFICHRLVRKNYLMAVDRLKLETKIAI